jgi:putative membrane protein
LRADTLARSFKILSARRVNPLRVRGFDDSTGETSDVTGERFDEARDATRRTRLANERTYLAWWRTGLTSFAVSFGAGRLVPELSGGPNWPFEAIGVVFGVVGVAFNGYGYVRQRAVDTALARGEYASLPNRAALTFAAVGVLLGITTIALLLVHPN